MVRACWDRLGLRSSVEGTPTNEKVSSLYKSFRESSGQGCNKGQYTVTICSFRPPLEPFKSCKVEEKKRALIEEMALPSMLPPSKNFSAIQKLCISRIVSDSQDGFPEPIREEMP